MKPLNNLRSIASAWWYNSISSIMSGTLVNSTGCTWRWSASVICSKSHQVCCVLVQEARLLTTSLYPLQEPLFGASSSGCSLPAGLHASLEFSEWRLPACQLFWFSTPESSWPSLHLLQPEAELAPGPSTPFVLRPWSSCWEQVACKAGEDRHQPARPKEVGEDVWWGGITRVPLRPEPVWPLWARARQRWGFLSVMPMTGEGTEDILGRGSELPFRRCFCCLFYKVHLVLFWKHLCLLNENFKLVFIGIEELCQFLKCSRIWAQYPEHRDRGRGREAGGRGQGGSGWYNVIFLHMEIVLC